MSADVAALRQRLDLLAAAGAAFAGAATPLQVADVAVTWIGRLLATDSVAVFELRAPDSLDAMTLGGWVDGAREAWTTMPLDAPAPVAEAARTRAPVWSESARAWTERFPHLVGMLDGYGYRGVLGLPLVAGEDLVGALGVGFTTDRTLDADARAAVVGLAAQCAQAMRRARLLQAETDARAVAERLTAMVAALSGARTPPQVLTAIRAAAADVGAARAVVALVRDGALELLDPDGPPVPGPGLTAAHPLAYAARTGDPVWLARRSELAWRDRSFADDAGPPVDLAVPMPLADTTIGALGLSFDGDIPHHSAQERQAIATLAAQCAQALDRARLQQAEHEIAETLQRALLPDRLPEPDRLALAARYLPAVEGARAGGDWYDVLQVDDARVAVVVGDVVGKGPAAAALMGQLRTALAVGLLRGDGPAEALTQLDRFAARIPAARSSTAVCVLVDWTGGDGRVRWASAGHPPPLLVGRGAPRRLDGAGPVLGFGGPFREQETAIEPGSTLVLHSDGLVERRDEPLDTGLRRLAAAAAAHAAEPPAALAAALLRAQFADTGPADDVALVLARFAPPPLRRTLPADPRRLREVRHELDAWAAAAGITGEGAEDLQLAVGEAVANAVEHAYPAGEAGAMTWSVRRDGDGSVAVEVRDGGRWRPPPANRGFRGRGLDVIGQLAAEVDVRPGPDGTTVAFRLPAPGPDGGDVPPTGRTPGPPPAPAALRDGPGGRVALHGDLDLAGVAAVGPALRAAATQGRGPLVLDLRGASHVASAGVALLLDTAQLARDRGRTVRTETAPGSRADRILTLCGVRDLLAAPRG